MSGMVWCAIRPCMKLFVLRSKRSFARSTGKCSALCPRRSPAATAIANSCWAPHVAERLTIARMGHRGDGIADTPAGLVYVPFTLPGEIVRAEPAADHPDRRQLVAIDEPSPDRVAPISPYFGSCGGCALQQWGLAKQQEWKRQKLIEALEHVGLRPEVAPTVDAHGEGRRRVVLHARRRGDRVEVGCAAARSHEIVSIDHCPILAPAM